MTDREKRQAAATRAWWAVGRKNRGVIGPCPVGALPAGRPELIAQFDQEYAKELAKEFPEDQ